MTAERLRDGHETGTAGHLAEVMSHVARELQEEHGDVEATLHAITRSAVNTIPGADACGITFVKGRKEVESRASTAELPRRVDALQERLHEGPSLDAVWHEEVVRVDDVGADERWPAFAAEASDLGVGNMLCFQLFVRADQLGAMNVYASAPHSFDEEAQDIGLMLASHAAVALAGAQQEENLRAGMGHRDLIGQAKGILMERYKLTPDQAFGLLVRTSSVTNRKLRDVAEELSSTGELPRRG
jgi:GAF domain-containing protein